MSALPYVPTAPPRALSVDQERRLVDLALRADVMRGPMADVAEQDPATRCQVVDAKYEPRSACTVLYELGPAIVTVVVDLSPDGTGTAPAGGGHEVGERMRAFVFPEDPVLANLGPLLDGAEVGALLADVVGAVVTCRVRLLRYRPGKRATLGLTVARRGSPPSAPCALVAKVYASVSKAAAVSEECRHLGSVLASRPGVVLAPVVAFLEQVPMVVQAHLGGVPLEPLLETGSTGRADARAEAGVAAAARALAAVHAAPVRTGRVRSSEAELRRFAKRAGRIAEVDPRQGAVLCDAVGKLARAYEPLPSAPTGLVHGDCKPSQFLLGDADVAVLDFDHVGLADPAYDVGAFMAALRKADVVEFLAGRPSGSRRPLERIFLDSYEPRQRRHDELALRVGWHQAAALVRKALRAYARAPRSPLPAALVAEAEQCLK